MLSRRTQNMKALFWAIALLAMLQPFAANCCVCKCDAAEDTRSRVLDDCCHGHEHDAACCSLSCSHEHGQPQDEAANQICDINRCGYGPCGCPPTCECQLRHAAPTMRVAEVNTRQLDQLAADLPIGDRDTCDYGTSSRLTERPVRNHLISSVSCCALLCRFVI